MRPISLLAAAGVLLVGGATTGVVAMADDDRGTSGDRGRSAEAPGQTEDKGGSGFGPPAWAQAHGKDKAAKADKHAWKDAWQAMSETERKALMKQLSAEHAAGMKAFAKCAEAAQGKPVDCAKPTPPGLAKKQS